MAGVTIALLTNRDGAELARRNGANRDYHAPWGMPCADAESFTAFYLAMEREENCCLVARSTNDGEMVAVVQLTRIARGNFQSAYLGYYGFRESAGRGLVREAMRLSLAYAFGPLGLHRVEANIQPGNLRSIALVRSLGFRREGFSPAYLRIGGEWRDHERWALLEPEFDETAPAQDD